MLSFREIKNYHYLIVIIFFSAIVGCEDVDVVELEIDYTPKIVVQAELIAGEFFEGVYLTNTVPLNEIYSDETAAIHDATLFLLVDSIQVIPLHYRGGGRYASFNEFRIVSNHTYELYGVVDDTNIYAKTIIPNMPVFSNPKFVPDGYLSSIIKKKKGEVYGALWLMTNNRLSYPFAKAKDFFSISDKDIEDFSDILVRTTILDNDYLAPFYADMIYMEVYSFDNSYYEYFLTKDNNIPVEDNFSQGGGPIKWNVQGDDVIGMFIGVAKTDFIKVSK